MVKEPNNKQKYSFINPDPTLQNNLMSFGFECGEGWFNLIIDCFNKIEEYIKNNPQEVLQIVQVKEKFGGLRIYHVGGDKFIEDLINETCNKSYSICENCGSSEEVTTTRIHGWIYTRCEKCFKDMEEKNLISN